MKKSNVIITVILVAISIFLLWLWYWLGFNQVDSPLDLVISIVWWVVIVIGIVLVIKTESTRQQRVRTVYLNDDGFFNAEVGSRLLAPGTSATEAIATTLAGLKYGFDKADVPTKPNTDEPIDFRYVVRSTKFDEGNADTRRSDGQQNEAAWEGEVVTVATGAVRQFNSKRELAAIIG